MNIPPKEMTEERLAVHNRVMVEVLAADRLNAADTLIFNLLSHIAFLNEKLAKQEGALAMVRSRWTFGQAVCRTVQGLLLVRHGEEMIVRPTPLLFPGELA